MLAASQDSCEGPRDSDAIQREQQEQVLAEGTRQTGMPAVNNFYMRKLMKDIIELCDQSGYVTYIYVKNEMTGNLVYRGQGVGYGIPAATQYTNPQKLVRTPYSDSRYESMPQADPDGLFKPSSAEGTYYMMKDPRSDDVKPVYFEERVTISPFKQAAENDPEFPCTPKVVPGYTPPAAPQAESFPQGKLDGALPRVGPGAGGGSN
jgi:hypothetical protein